VDRLTDEARDVAGALLTARGVTVCSHVNPDGDAVGSVLGAVLALRAAGITSETSFWIGFPDETPATVEETLSRALAWDPDTARFPLVTPMPYTPAWRTWGPHVITRDYRRFNQAEPVVKPLGMELDEVAAAADRCRRSFERANPTRFPPGGARRAGPWAVHSVAIEPADGEGELAPDEPFGRSRPPRLPRR
jgi:hypothetical protein